MTERMNPTLGTVAASPIVPLAYRAGGDTNTPAGYERVAVIVHHGMGQQVPYETIEGVAKAIWSQMGQEPPQPIVRYSRLGVSGNNDVEPELVRAELHLSGEVEGQERNFEVHIYESYWAPLTEGQVTIRDVITFLFRAGVNGFFNTTARTFRRWMFGDGQHFELPTVRLMLILGGLMALVGALVFINSVLTAAAAAHVIGSQNPFPSGNMLRALTWDMIVLDLAGIVIAAGIFAFGASRLVSLRTAGWVLIYGGASVVALIAGLMAIHVNGWSTWPVLPRPPSQLTCLWKADAGGNWLDWLVCHRFALLVVWAIEIALAAGVRWTLIEYVGDVTGYIAAYSVSKFWKLRQDIRDVAMKVTRAVYRAKEEGTDEFLYRKIIVVGHSLGSVISYDVLNSLLLEASVSPDPLLVPERTRMFLTFGSPLDKTAFLFRTLKDMNSAVREVGAAAVQPMIANYAFRPQEWVNLWSYADIISGHLDYYDLPTVANAKNKHALRAVPPAYNRRRVNNQLDPSARTPLKAHVEYWAGPAFAQHLVRGITTN